MSRLTKIIQKVSEPEVDEAVRALYLEQQARLLNAGLSLEESEKFLKGKPVEDGRLSSKLVELARNRRDEARKKRLEAKKEVAGLLNWINNK